MIQPTRFKHSVLPRFGRQIVLGSLNRETVVWIDSGRLRPRCSSSTSVTAWRFDTGQLLPSRGNLQKVPRSRPVRVFHFPCLAWEGLFLASSFCSSILIRRFTGEKHEACSLYWLGLMQDQGRLRRQPVLPWIEACSVLGVVSQTFLRDSRPRIAPASEPGRNTYQRYAP